MLLCVDVVCALLLSVSPNPPDTIPAIPVPPPTVAAPLAVSQPSALGQRGADALPELPGIRLSAESFTGLGVADPASANPASADTVRKPRRKAFEYSDAYQTRLQIHKWLSWTMLPLFAASYITGDELLKANAAGRRSKDWARQWHGPAATGSAVLFGVNGITGVWNMYEGWGDPNGRTRRLIHSVLFMAASGGFVYAGSKLANDAEQSQDKRIQHRNIAVASMGVSTLSWLIMLIGN